MNRTIFIAHRGESIDAPENTLAAINLAWERNADAVEVDVHLTADNKIAVIHDSSTKRTGRKYLKVSNHSFSELKKINVGTLKGSKFADEKIPSLEEVLDTVPVNKMLLVEIKSGLQIINELYDVIKKSKVKPEQVKIIGFNLQTMSYLKENFNSHEIFWIRKTGMNYLNFRKDNYHDIISTSLKYGFNGLDVKYSKLINQQFVDRIKKAGLRLFVWTVNDPQTAKDLVDMGVDGITSDNQYYIRENIRLLQQK